jgi:uncharacterized protein (DUF1330 family)
MTHYMIVQVEVKDDSWIPDYAEKVHHIVHKHGGKYLSRSGNIKTLEGPESTASLIALIEFPSMDALQAFVSDPEYKPFLEKRLAGTNSHMVVVDTSDAAGTIPYLVAGP